MIHFVVHEEGDGVGVVVVEGVKAGQHLAGWIMEDDKDLEVVAKNDIPIGHKLALRDYREGDTVIKYGVDIELHFRTLIGTGSNPNVAAVVVICIEEEWAKKVADGIRATGKPVAHFGIEQHGDHDTIMRASKAAREFLQQASELRREERPLKDL